AVAGTFATRSNVFLERIEDYRTVAEVVVGGQGDIERLLDATARIATRSTTLLEDAASDFDVTVRSMAAVLRGVYDERELIPAAFDTIGAFFDMLGAGMRMPGPPGSGKNLTALKGFVTVDLCLVYGVCLLPEGGIAPPSGPAPPVPTPAPAPAPTPGPITVPLLDDLLSDLGLSPS
ncbi:MAG: hypothetical protein Q8K58_14540, partial [Acidimicrobiales bacterium]|nr:hypothetical protein [Acidimicrobiales bacterium]